MDDGEISAPELDFFAGELGVLHSPDVLLVSMLFTAQLVCSIECDSWRGIFALSFAFTWPLVLNRERFKIKVQPFSEKKPAPALYC